MARDVVANVVGVVGRVWLCQYHRDLIASIVQLLMTRIIDGDGQLITITVSGVYWWW